MYLITDSKATVNTLGLTNDEIKECINENLRVNPDDDVLAYSLDWTSWVICNGYLKRKEKDITFDFTNNYHFEDRIQIIHKHNSEIMCTIHCMIYGKVEES